MAHSVTHGSELPASTNHRQILLGSVR